MCINPQTVTGIDGIEYKIPCGKCILCRMKRAQNWAIKLIKEGCYHTKMCMVTMTFNPKDLIEHKEGSNVLWSKNLVYSKNHFQKFMKRLRKRFPSGDISYFKVGEYGELHGRAHYHLLLYGIDKNDLKCKIIGKSKKNKEIYQSNIIDDCWKLGMCTVSDVNNATIKYVCNYTLKKLKSTEKRPVISFSNRNKIGTKWLRRNHKDIRKGYVLDSENKKYGIPRSWKNELKKVREHEISRIETEKTLLKIEEVITDYLDKAEKNGKLSLDYLLKIAKKREYEINHRNDYQRLDL